MSLILRILKKLIQKKKINICKEKLRYLPYHVYKFSPGNHMKTQTSHRGSNDNKYEKTEHDRPQGI